LGYEIAGFDFGDKLFSMNLYSASSFAGSMWVLPYFFLLKVFLLAPWRLVIGRQGFLFLVGYSTLVVRVCIWFFLI
jgi:hypothetical protein